MTSRISYQTKGWRSAVKPPIGLAVGLLRAAWTTPDRHDQCDAQTVFTRSDDPHAAQLANCNRFNGKWNARLFDGWTVETAIYDLRIRLRMVLG